eukprot:4988206-Pleurochrysis_carterae.AAC.1
MAAKSLQRRHAVSSLLSVPGAALWPEASVRAPLSRCKCAGATRKVMFESASSRAAFAVATACALSRCGVRVLPGRQVGERGR